MVTKHGSLTAPPSRAPVLKPQRKMGPNVPCWCLSGKKWKKCHERREYEKEITWEESQARSKAVFKAGVCLHPSAPVGCTSKIVSAHTVQRGGGLKYISDNNHVLSPKDEVLRLLEQDGDALIEVAMGKSLFNPLSVTIKRASTFYGFCSAHDGPLFAPVENHPWPPTKKNVFLLSLRAIAYESYVKFAALKSNEIDRQTMDLGLPFEGQAAMQQRLFDEHFGLEMGVRDTKAWKRAYDDAYNRSDYSAYRFALLDFKPRLPIAVCGALHPEFDFQGNPLQKLARETSDFEHLTINITNEENRCIVVLGWIGSDHGPSAQFVRSFLSLPDDQKSHAVIRLAFEYFENTYLNPQWWRNLSTQLKQALSSRYFSSTEVSPGRKPNSLTDDAVRFFDSQVVSSTGLVL
jgi:hypothetical protein